MKIIKIILQLVLFTFFLATAFVLVTAKTDKLAGIKSLVVLTGSMQPAISQGSIIFTKPENIYSKGDIVAFNIADKIVTHRIVDAKNSATSFTTKGDANNAIDSQSVEKKDVIGKTVFVLPYLGSLAQGLKTLPGFLLAVVLPALIFIALELRVIYRELKKDIERKVLEKQTA